MIIKFTKKEALICSFCFSNKPSFQMISLEPVPGKAGGLVSTCTTTLLCDECLKPELDDFHRSLEQTETPLGQGETEDESPYRQIVVLENALRSTVSSIDSQLPLTQVQTMDQTVADSEGPRRFNTAVVSAFAGAALLLAVLGIYSVIAFSVASRVQEMAIRMALGSQRSGILRLILTSAAKLGAIGCAIGVLGALALSRLLRSSLL